MQGMTEAEHKKYDAVRTYLEAYKTAFNYETLCLNERQSRAVENHTNPAAKVSGFSSGVTGSGNKSLGAASSLENVESISAFNNKQSKLVDEMKGRVIAAIDLLDLGFGRTIIEMRHIDLYEWRYIDKRLQICRTTRYKYYRDEILELYDRMVAAGLIKPI